MAASVTLATALFLQACGGGGGDRDAEVISQGLVADGPASCSLRAQVYTGPDVVHDPGGTCLVPVSFDLFDPSGNPMNVSQPITLLNPQQTIDLEYQICSGQRGITVAGFGQLPSGPPSLFLIPGVDRCPSGTRIGVPVPDTSLVRPLAEVPCAQIGRVQTTLTPCG